MGCLRGIGKSRLKSGDTFPNGYTPFFIQLVNLDLPPWLVAFHCSRLFDTSEEISSYLSHLPYSTAQAY